MKFSMSIQTEVFCYICIQKLKGLRAHSLALIATDAENISIHLNCFLTQANSQHKSTQEKISEFSWDFNSWINKLWVPITH